MFERHTRRLYQQEQDFILLPKNNMRTRLETRSRDYADDDAYCVELFSAPFNSLPLKSAEWASSCSMAGPCICVFGNNFASVSCWLQGLRCIVRFNTPYCLTKESSLFAVFLFLTRIIYCLLLFSFARLWPSLEWIGRAV